MSDIHFVLEPMPPFRLDLTVWVLRRRPDNVVDRWDGRTYRRVLALEGQSVEVAVTQIAPPDMPQLQVIVTGGCCLPDVTPAVTVALERLLGLRSDLREFYRFAASDARLGPLAQRFRGFKPPRFLTVFEALVNGIACQQITLTQGIRLLNALARTAGPALADREGTAYAFPRPPDLARLELEELKALGFSRQKARALMALSHAVASLQLDLEGLVALGDEAALTTLCQLRGVGRWTAEYALLRGLGRLHLFPGDDVGARNNLRRWLSLSEPLDYAGVQCTIAHWRPYGGLLYFHLLLDRLAAAGYLY